MLLNINTFFLFDTSANIGQVVLVVCHKAGATLMVYFKCECSTHHAYAYTNSILPCTGAYRESPLWWPSGGSYIYGDDGAVPCL